MHLVSILAACFLLVCPSAQAVQYSLQARLGLGPVQSLTWTADSKNLVTAGPRGLAVWSLNPLKVQRKLGWDQGAQQAVTADPKGKTLASCSAAGIQFWNLKSGKVQKTLRKAPGPPAVGGALDCQELKFSGDGKHLLVQQYGHLFVWNLYKNQWQGGLLLNASRKLMDLKASHEGLLLITQEQQGASAIQVYRATWQELMQFPALEPGTGEGHILAPIRTYQVKAHQIFGGGRAPAVAMLFPVLAYTTPVDTSIRWAQFDASGEGILFCSNVRVFSAKLAGPQMRPTGQGCFLYASTLAERSPDGKWLAIYGEQNRPEVSVQHPVLALWPFGGPKPVRSSTGPFQIAWKPWLTRQGQVHTELQRQLALPLGDTLVTGFQVGDAWYELVSRQLYEPWRTQHLLTRFSSQTGKPQGQFPLVWSTGEQNRDSLHMAVPGIDHQRKKVYFVANRDQLYRVVVADLPSMTLKDLHLPWKDTRDLALSSNGNFLAVHDGETKVRVWDLLHKRVHRTVDLQKSNPWLSMGFDAAGSLYLGTYQGTLVVRNAAGQGAAPQVWTSRFRFLQASADGKLLLAEHELKVQVLRSADLKVLQQLELPADIWTFKVQMSVDQKTLFLTLANGVVEVYGLTSTP